MREVLRKMKRVTKIVLGWDFFVKPDCHYSYQRFGSEYGGWNVAVSQLNENSIIYSFGVGEDASFDIALMQKYGCVIHAFDPTPRSFQWVQEQNFPPDFIMHNYGISNRDGLALFNPPENPAHVSHTLLDRLTTKDKAIEVSVKKLSTTMKELGHWKIDLLKMDIEGAEYLVIEDIKNNNSPPPKQLLIEFHHRFNNVGINKTKDAIKTIKEMGYFQFQPLARNSALYTTENNVPIKDEPPMGTAV